MQQKDDVLGLSSKTTPCTTILSRVRKRATALKLCSARCTEGRLVARPEPIPHGAARTALPSNALRTSASVLPAATNQLPHTLTALKLSKSKMLSVPADSLALFLRVQPVHATDLCRNSCKGLDRRDRAQSEAAQACRVDIPGSSSLLVCPTLRMHPV